MATASSRRNKSASPTVSSAASIAVITSAAIIIALFASIFGGVFVAGAWRRRRREPYDETETADEDEDEEDSSRDAPTPQAAPWNAGVKRSEARLGSARPYDARVFAIRAHGSAASGAGPSEAPHGWVPPGLGYWKEVSADTFVRIMGVVLRRDENSLANAFGVPVERIETLRSALEKRRAVSPQSRNPTKLTFHPMNAADVDAEARFALFDHLLTRVRDARMRVVGDGSDMALTLFRIDRAWLVMRETTERVAVERGLYRVHALACFHVPAKNVGHCARVTALTHSSGSAFLLSHAYDGVLPEQYAALGAKPGVVAQSL